MDYVAYTIFADRSLTEVREVAHLFGPKAKKVLRIFKDSLGRDARDGDVIPSHGVRIDRIGSEDISDLIAAKTEEANALFCEGDQASAILVIEEARDLARSISESPRPAA